MNFVRFSNLNVLLVLVALFCVLCVGQGRPVHSSPRAVPFGDSSVQREPSTVLLSGTVVIDGTRRLPGQPMIVCTCGMQTYQLGYADKEGEFNFQFHTGLAVQNATADVSTSAPASAIALQDCEFWAELAGFSSTRVRGNDNLHWQQNVGTIVLSPLSKAEELTTSGTTFNAPERARSEYQRGCELARKRNWNAAREQFQRAVKRYAKYAEAWLALGRVQAQEGDRTGAQQSFQNAMNADPRFIPPYEELAAVILLEKNWHELARIADRGLSFNPLDSPGLWLYHALANYFLGDFAVAAKSARKGIAVDDQHRVPKLEFLLGMTLIAQRDFRGAVEHLRSYVRLSPKAVDAVAAQQQADELERIVAPIQNR